jgi:hypothetical protein
MTKQDLIAHIRSIYEEAVAADPYYMHEATHAIVGSDVFVWANLTMQQLHAIGRSAYVVVLQARG